METRFKIAAAALALTIAPLAQADMIDMDDNGSFETNVGFIDVLIDTTNDLTEGGTVACPGAGGGSNPRKEECWAEWALGGGIDLDFSDSTKTENVPWYMTDSGNIAFELNHGPGWYLVKNAQFWGLFENVPMIDWGVIDGALRDIANLGSDMMISHVTESPGVTRDVPEPGTLSLLGLGLLGLGLQRRRNKKV